MAPGRRIKKKSSSAANPQTLHQQSKAGPGVVTMGGPLKTEEGPSALMKTHDRFRRVLSTIPQSPSRSSPTFENGNLIPATSRSSSPEADVTPRPLRVLKGRRSFLKLAELASSTTSIPMFNGQRRALSAEHAVQSVPQPVDVLLDIVGRGTSPLSSPARTFMGLKLTSPKSRVASPDPLPRGPSLASPQSPEEEKTYGSRRISNNARNLNNILASDINHQNIKLAEGPTQKTASTGPFIASAYIPHWMNWKQRSNSDGQSSKSRPVFEKAAPRAMSVVPGTIYEAGRTVPESNIDTLTQISRDVSSPPRALRRAISAGPTYLSLNQSAAEIVNSTEKIDDMDSSGTGFNLKPSILSRLLPSVQDLTKQSYESPAVSTTCSTTDISRQTSISITDTISGHYVHIVSNENINEDTVSIPVVANQTESKAVSKGSFRSRRTFGSIRRRFGSSTEKSTDSSESKCTVTCSEISTPEITMYCPWVHPPMLKPNISIFSELVREHVEGGKEFWVCVELSGRVSYTNKIKDISMKNVKGSGLNIAIIMDLSAHASPSTFNQTKETARRIITSLNSSDNVSLIAYTSIQSSPGVEAKYPLTRLTASAQAKLLDFIDGLFSHAHRQGIITHDIKTLIATTMGDLAESLTKSTPTHSSHGTAHVLLLASNLKAGDVPDDVIFQQKGRIQLHFLGMGPLVKIGKYPGPGSWILNSLITSESELCSPELKKAPGADVIEFLDILRCEIDVGILSRVRLDISPGDGCEIMDIIGETCYNTLAPGESKVVCVKLRAGPYYPQTAPETPANTPERKKTLTEIFASRASSISETHSESIVEEHGVQGISERKLLERQLAATLGVIETKALGVIVKYEHSSFGDATELTIRKTLNIHRFDGDGFWSLGRSKTITRRSGKSELVERAQNEHIRVASPSGRDSVAIDEEDADDFIKYARTILAKKVAEKHMGMMDDHPKKALKAVEEWGVRGRGVHAIASELEWRVKMKDDEVETERTMRGLKEELVREGAKHDVNFDNMNEQQVFNGSMRGAIMNVSPSGESIRSSYSWRTGAFYGASSTQPITNERQNANSDNEQADKSTSSQIPGTRSSSVVIHRVPYARDSSPISQNTEMSESSHQDDCNTSTRTSKSPSLHHRMRHDHVDEAGRVWKELAESKMGLRRDVRPGRYRGGGGAAVRHSRSSSVDILFKWERGREYAEAGGNKLKKPKRGYRRLKKQQPMKRNSRSLIGNVSYRGQVLEEKSRSFGCGIGSALDVSESKVHTGSGETSSPDGGQDVVGQEGDWAMQSDIERCNTAESATTMGEEVNGESNMEDCSGKSNRDTMKSLITLRDVKETDFSP